MAAQTSQTKCALHSNPCWTNECKFNIVVLHILSDGRFVSNILILLIWIRNIQFLRFEMSECVTGTLRAPNKNESNLLCSHFLNFFRFLSSWFIHAAHRRNRLCSRIIRYESHAVSYIINARWEANTGGNGCQIIGYSRKGSQGIFSICWGYVMKY